MVLLAMLFIRPRLLPQSEQLDSEVAVRAQKTGVKGCWDVKTERNVLGSPENRPESMLSFAVYTCSSDSLYKWEQYRLVS